MRFEADLLFEINFGCRLEALYRLFFLLAKKLFDGVTHAFGFHRGLGFGLDPKPGLPAWSIANVFRASSQFPTRARIANHRAGAALSAEDDTPPSLGPQPSLTSIGAYSV